MFADLGRVGQGVPLSADAGGCRSDVPTSTDARMSRTCAVPKINVPPSRSYCLHEHKGGGLCGSGGQCPLKPNRTLNSNLHPSFGRHPRRSVNFSTDSSDSAVSGVSLPDVSSVSSSQGYRRGSQGNNERKHAPTVKFQADSGPGDTRSLDRPAKIPTKGPMSKFGYNNPNNRHGNSDKKLSQQNGSYSNHDRQFESDNYNTRQTGLSDNSEQTKISSQEADQDSQSKYENGGNTTRLKGILKNTEEPIRRCINDSLTKYQPRRSWSGVSGRDITDAISEDGNTSVATTTSGSYILDNDEICKEVAPSPPDPKEGFMV